MESEKVLLINYICLNKETKATKYASIRVRVPEEFSGDALLDVVLKSVKEEENIEENFAILSICDAGVNKPNKEFNSQSLEIGGHTWMTENLAYDDGEGGVIINKGNYYYTWDAAVRISKKLGWNLPSSKDWDTLCKCCGEITKKEKETVQEYKERCESVSKVIKELNIDLSGFYHKGLPHLGKNANFWTIDECSITEAYYVCFEDSCLFKDVTCNKNDFYFSVRLIK